MIPVLALPKPNKSFVVFNYVSKYGFGCVLIQKDYMVVYASRQLIGRGEGLAPFSLGEDVILLFKGSKVIQTTKDIRV